MLLLIKIVPRPTPPAGGMYEWTELLLGILELPVTTSPVLIPTTESITIVDDPDPTVANTVLILVTSPTFMMASFTVALVELTVVVVPSTCKSPLMITVPSLLNPSGYGSMNS